MADTTGQDHAAIFQARPAARDSQKLITVEPHGWPRRAAPVSHPLAGGPRQVPMPHNAVIKLARLLPEDTQEGLIALKTRQSAERHNSFARPFDGVTYTGKKGILPGLTGVRGMAAMGVFLCHLQPLALKVLGADPAGELHFIASGFRGVDLFFILSGFILFHVHCSELSSIRSNVLLRFYLSRFFRVYPLNTVVLLALLPLALMLPDFVAWYRAEHLSQGAYHLMDFSLGGFVQSVLLSQTWTIFNLGTWNEPAWTLSAEVLGYAFFPLLAWFVVRQGSAVRLLAASISSLAILVYLLALFGHFTGNPSGLFGVIRMVFCFFAGICICRCFHLLTVPPTVTRRLTLLSLIVIVSCFQFDNIGGLSIFGFSGLIFGLAYEKGVVSYFLTTRPLIFFGKISFSFYLVHLIPLNVFAWMTGDSLKHSGSGVKVAVLTSLVVGCVLLALITYEFVEVPSQRIGRIISSRFS